MMNSNIFSLPKLQIKLEKNSLYKKTLVAIAGGREPDGDWLRDLLLQYPGSPVYCADKGAAYCLKNDLQPAYVYGDADSAGEGVFQMAKNLGAEVEIYPQDKDDTDLQLLIKRIPPCSLVISGVFGGRLDHLYSNIFSLLSGKKEKLCTVIMADDSELLLLLEAGESAVLSFCDESSPEAISLLPLCEQTVVSVSGVKWPLDKEELSLKRPYAISNEPLDRNKDVYCKCFSGYVGLYCSFK